MYTEEDVNDLRFQKSLDEKFVNRYKFFEWRRKQLKKLNKTIRDNTVKKVFLLISLGLSNIALWVLERFTKVINLLIVIRDKKKK
ncbi:hypothetical protein LCGC14_2270720 [marine sediment metagenome]|uniref:Uncharacterized protein n=1 Tax=marine sediment metagenome TaxID=412755 RepID=A0A0F9DJA0_9ZZZZ